MKFRIEAFHNLFRGWKFTFPRFKPPAMRGTRFFVIDSTKTLLLILVLAILGNFSFFHGYRQEMIVNGPGKLHLRNLIQERQFFLGQQISMRLWFEEADNSADQVSVLNEGKRFEWRGFGSLWKWEVEDEIPFFIE